LPKWLRETVLWEGSDPYLYLRTTPDRRLIVGGEDEEDAGDHQDRSLMKRKAATLVKKAGELLPHVRISPSHVWAGAFGETRDSLPVIDRLPGVPHCHVVAGFGGNGVTYSVIAAEVIAALLRGTPDPDADLYRVR
jgi:glycine/D-amino acid oxidase-like deaminating enzyme